ncbi:hypothetical protein ScPMuIL_016330 [Solemya velum]
MAQGQANAAKISLIKRGWHELPELMCTFGLMAVGTVAASVAGYKYITNGDLNHQYKFKYTVIRDTEVKNPGSPTLN